MSLHIQMTEEAERELRRTALRNKLSSLAACLAFILLGGGILYFTVILIAGDVPAAFISYTPPAEDGPPTNTPVQKELTHKSSSPSADVSPTVIVAQGATAVNMAPVNISTTEGLDFSANMDIGMGLDGGLGEGLGDGGSGLGSGTAGGSALEGTFYDLKLTRAGASTGIQYDANSNALVGDGQNRVLEILNGFLKDWRPATLNKYYSSPTKLYASNFFLPVALAAYAPIAYKCADRCKPSGWVAIYRGRVRAPKTGKFRFVGTGDDFLAVRFNRKTVLEAGYRIPSRWTKENPGLAMVSRAFGENHKAYQKGIADGTDKAHKGYEFIKLRGLNIWNDEVGGLTAGAEFEVKEGQAYPIEICISEIPGGKFGFVLLIEDVTNGKAKSSQSNKYDLFRTNFSMPNVKEIDEMLKKEKCNVGNAQAPAYNEDSPIWTAVP